MVSMILKQLRDSMKARADESVWLGPGYKILTNVDFAAGLCFVTVSIDIIATQTLK